MSTIVVLEVSHILYGNPLQLTARGEPGRPGGMQSPLLPRGPAQRRRAHPHSPGRPRRPGRMQSASTGSTATRHATPDSSLGRGVDKQGLRLDSAPRQRVSGSGRSPSSVGRHPVVFTARARSTSRRPRRVPRRGQLDRARAQVSAVTERGGESNYLDSHTIPST